MDSSGRFVVGGETSVLLVANTEYSVDSYQYEFDNVVNTISFFVHDESVNTFPYYGYDRYEILEFTITNIITDEKFELIEVTGITKYNDNTVFAELDLEPGTYEYNLLKVEGHIYLDDIALYDTVLNDLLKQKTYAIIGIVSSFIIGGIVVIVLKSKTAKLST